MPRGFPERVSTYILVFAPNPCWFIEVVILLFDLSHICLTSSIGAVVG